MTGGRFVEARGPGNLGGAQGDVVLTDELHVFSVDIDQQCLDATGRHADLRDPDGRSQSPVEPERSRSPAHTSRRFKSQGAERSETAFRWSWWRFTTLETSTFFTFREVVGMPSQPIALVPASATRYTALRILSFVE